MTKLKLFSFRSDKRKCKKNTRTHMLPVLIIIMIFPTIYQFAGYFKEILVYLLFNMNLIYSMVGSVWKKLLWKTRFVL